MRIRSSVLLAFLISLIFAAYLGFAKITLPNDKLVHFTTFFTLTVLFYWLFETQHIRYIRNLTLLVCTLGAGVGSEFVQSLVPYRTFDLKDILCNITGSGLAVIICQIWHKRLLVKRRELRYLQLRQSIPDEDEEMNMGFHFEMDSTTNVTDDCQSGGAMTLARLSNDLSMFDTIPEEDEMEEEGEAEEEEEDQAQDEGSQGEIQPVLLKNVAPEPC